MRAIFPPPDSDGSQVLRIHVFSCGTTRTVRLPLSRAVLLYIRVITRHEQVLDLSVVVLTRNCVKFKTIGLERHLAGANHSSSAQSVVQQGILSASKTILPESDLILRNFDRRCSGERQGARG